MKTNLKPSTEYKLLSTIRMVKFWYSNWDDIFTEFKSIFLTKTLKLNLGKKNKNENFNFDSVFYSEDENDVKEYKYFIDAFLKYKYTFIDPNAGLGILSTAVPVIDNLLTSLAKEIRYFDNKTINEIGKNNFKYL